MLLRGDSSTNTTRFGTLKFVAALTGHLLISTLHTNDAVGAVARLSDLGLDHFKISGALLASVAQRLLREICPDCRRSPILVKRDVERAVGFGDVAVNQLRQRRCG